MVLAGKVILITGGTGSLGKILARRILSGEKGVPKKVIILSRDEAKQHEMRVSYLGAKTPTDEVIYRNFRQTLEFRIGDVRNYADVCSAIRGVEIVINAAALKQVPSCEYFSDQAILTNCIGAMNLVRAVGEHGESVKTVVGVSTDKACLPVNVMGMTKALQERIFISANILNPGTRFVCVRYGNVLASRGSVIPLFHDQIMKGGPVTLTVPEMTRFLLSLDQAVDTVFGALEGARRGEIYVPNAPSATVLNIAKALIGERPIEIKVVGVRPAEKKHELMVSDLETDYSEKRGRFYAIRPMLPELLEGEPGPKALEKEFSSADNVLNLADTVELLRSHRLLIEQREAGFEGELLA